jgi:hypothetical protein
MKRFTIAVVVLASVVLLTGGMLHAQKQAASFTLKYPGVASPISDSKSIIKSAVYDRVYSASPRPVTVATSTSAVMLAGGNELVSKQNTDGGWGWPLTGASETNTIGPIAMGLAGAYQQSGSSSQRTALTTAGTYLLAKTNNFSPSDGYIAAQLDKILGVATYTSFVKTNFYDQLAAGTYNRNGSGTLYSTASYINLISTNRHSWGQGNMAAWDIGLGLVGAASVGASTSEWIAGVKAEIDSLNGNDYYDVIGLAGAIYGLAYVHQDYNPVAGQHAAASNINDLANILLSYQISGGGFAWNSNYVIPNDGDEANQETAYAILALNAVNRSTYLTAIRGAADYLKSVQLGTGGWEDYPSIHDGENNELTGEVLWGIMAVYPTSVYNVTKTVYYPTIQGAINDAVAGNEIDVAAGTFNESVTVDKMISLIGAGSTIAGTIITPSSGNGIIVSASGVSSSSRIVLKDLRVTGAAGHGVEINASNASFLKFDNVACISNGGNGINVNPPTGAASFADFILLNCDLTSNAVSGLRFPTYAGINGLVITNGHMDGNVYGWQTYSSVGSPLVTNVTVTGTTFNNNTSKGMYFENIDHAAFTGVMVSNSGTVGANGAGVDVNLKYHAFMNVAFSNATITGCGTGDAVNGVGIAVKARNDGSYAANPATLANVQITGCTITGCQEGIRFGEPTKNNPGPTGVAVHSCNITGSILKGMRNESLALTNAESNWWGNATGPYNATLNPTGTGNAASDNIDFDPWTGKPTGISVKSDSVNHTYHVLNTDATVKFTTLPPGTNATVTIQETPTIPAGIPALPSTAGTVPPLYLVINGGGLVNGTFSVTVTLNVSAIVGFSSTTEVMYYSATSSSWVGISGTYAAGPPATYTFTTDHFTPFIFVNPLNPDDLYLSTSTSDVSKNIFYPQATGTIYGADDWSYSPMVVPFYVEPRGTQGFVAAKFTIHCDPTMATLTYGGGAGPFLLGNWNINTSVPAPGAILVEIANLSPTINHVPGPPDRLAFTLAITKPGYNPITIDGIDFRYFVAGPDTQASVYVTSHPGAIKFYLGDVASTSPASVNYGDGLINYQDLVPWSLAYWSKASDYPSTTYKAKYDFGPTNTSGAYFAMPTPDGKIEFEDLVIFAIGYGKSGAGQLPKETAKPVTLALGSMQTTGGEVRVPIALSGLVSDVRALSMILNYSSTGLTFKGIEKAGEMNNDHSFMISKAENGKLMIDGAVLGLENNGLSHAGVIAYAVFTGKGTVGIESAKARSSANSAIEVKYEKGMMQSNAVPDRYALAQNYPNPFNPATTIHYALAKAGHVEVVIYNMLGEVIATLVNGEQNAGYYDVTWNGQNDKHQTVASGIYLYRMRSGDFVDVQKMVLMK